MENLDLLIDLHLDAERQGPGGDEETRLAVRLARLAGAAGLKIADIGCGTGASALLLAQHLEADVIAVDFLPVFLSRLEEKAARKGLAGRIETRAASMEALDFAENSLDAIWSEGAIYNMGFEEGVRAWRRFLKPEGVLAVSELTWLTGERPPDLERYWRGAYPQVATASEKMALLEANGYSPLGYFALSKRCWLDNYYWPMQARFADFLARHDASEAARAVVAAEAEEISLYERYAPFFSYGFYVARRTKD